MFATLSAIVFGLALGLSNLSIAWYLLRDIEDRAAHRWATGVSAFAVMVGLVLWTVEALSGFLDSWMLNLGGSYLVFMLAGLVITCIRGPSPSEVT